MTYALPANVPVSDTWEGHKNRPVPSVEPGTDYATAYGTPVGAAASGTVSAVYNSVQGGTGRFVRINLDDGRAVRYLHLSRIYVYVGQRVSAGTVIGLSGASGRGSEWGYGAHVHVTLLPNQFAAFSASIDFQKYAGAIVAATPSPATEEENDMWRINVRGEDLVYMLTGGKLIPLTDPRTLAEMEAQKVPTMNLGRGEVDNLLKALK